MLGFSVAPDHLRSRSVSGRSIIRPDGNQGYGFVKKGNLLLSRVILLLLLASAKGARWLLEQPANSCLPDCPRWTWFTDRVAALWLQFKLELCCKCMIHMVGVLLIAPKLHLLC